VSSYRFCRTDDIGLLVDALNRCWAPHFPAEPLMTPEAFKRSIRDLQVWCSSCMVAFAGGDPIAVLIGAKRSTSTLIHRIAVHPDHVRQGHGRHLLTSLSSKLSILGPPRLVGEVPEALPAGGTLFEACGYVEEARLTDYILTPSTRADSPPWFVIPVTLDDLDANGLLGGDGQPRCWQRSIETLTARKDAITGLAVASDERIEACVLAADSGEILSLRSFVDDGDARLRHLLSLVSGRGPATLRLPKAHPSEMSGERLAALGFRPAGAFRQFAATARSA
jgi:GNAT superfamily N-acetyltransferase